jgi:micrococcal nuclease
VVRAHPIIAGFIAIVAAGPVNACASSAESTPARSSDVVAANAVVESVVDGDTIDVTIAGRSERVRLIGIDTPETKKRDSPVECFGPEATSFTEALLPVGTRIRIERDVVGRDDYGRLLGYVRRAEDGIFVNDELVRRGYAQPLSIEPNTVYAPRFVEASRAAERADLGLWGACAV